MADPFSSGKVLKQAEHIWKMLDELADTDPEAYKKFVEKSMKEGKKDLADTKKNDALFINICGWTKVPGPKGPTDAVPVSGGPLEDVEFDSDHCWVTRVAINPEVLKECSERNEEMRLLIQLVFQFLENQHNIRISQDYTILKKKYMGNPAELENFFSKRQKSAEECARDELKRLCPEDLLAQLGKMKTGEEMSKIPSTPNPHSERHGKGKLIEEISSKVVTLPQPDYELITRDKDEKKGRRIVLRVSLPGVQAVSECDLQIDKQLISLHVDKKYNLDVEIPEAFQESSVSAKFIKKTSVLSITLPLIEDL
ncbi:PIH1 domain-containing protein 2 [Holothuria leucospilota]|uniref:PIH1 domain-containing protein 2 n=1 Tax=Holothuria leucospilota TaxID=206669 RepID=A0A9Q1BXT8_HOLLE|nr:PIH1 domain-containing protein 2 [Holothuria leucospilota]